MKKEPCRFFFPFNDVQAEQCQNADLDRIIHIRRHPVDDNSVAAHNLEQLIRAGSPVQMQIFDPVKGGRMAGVYCVLYTGKSENVLNA